MLNAGDILSVRGPDVIVASSTTNVRDAAKMMSQANVGSVIVKDGQEVRGIFTERDALTRVTGRSKDPDTTLLGEVMSSPVATCRLEDDVQEIMERLTSQHIRHLAIMEDGALIGIIGLRDIMAATIHEKDQHIRELQEQV